MAYLSALYLYNSESGFNKEIEKSSEITLIAPSIDKYSAIQEQKKNIMTFVFQKEIEEK